MATITTQHLCLIGMLLTGVMVIQNINNFIALLSAPILFLSFAWIMFDSLELNDRRINNG